MIVAVAVAVAVVEVATVVIVVIVVVVIGRAAVEGVEEVALRSQWRRVLSTEREGEREEKG